MSKTSKLKWFFFGQGPSWRRALDETEKTSFNVNPNGIRERIKEEDSLLNNRTNIFLIVNGIGLVAIGIDKSISMSPAVLCGLMALVDLLWFYCSRQSLKVLAALTKFLRYINPDDPLENLVQEVLGGGWKHWIRPATILAVYLPFLKFLGWTIWGAILV